MSKLLSLIPIFAPVLLMGVLLVLAPHEIIRLQGRFYRRIYKGWLKQTDREMERSWQLPTDRAVMGKRSEFAAEAPENPHRYSTLILWYRIFGVITLLLVLGASGIAVFAALVGALK